MTQRNHEEIHLLVNYEDRQIMNKLGCKFNGDFKTWYTTYDKLHLVDDYIKIYLDAKFDERNIIKQYKGKWDPDVKQWYTYKGNKPLLKYMSKCQFKNIDNKKYFYSDDVNVKIILPLSTQDLELKDLYECNNNILNCDDDDEEEILEESF